MASAFQFGAFQLNAFQIDSPAKRGGATYLTPAELRELRKAEAKRRAELEARDRTIEQAYEDAVHPEIRIAREEAERVRKHRREQLDQEDEDFLFFLTEHLERLDEDESTTGPPDRRIITALRKPRRMH